MLLTPTELERLTIFSAAELARKRRARGRRLNAPEAIAIICDEILEGARDGQSVAELISFGSTILNQDDVMPAIADLVPMIQVEATFPDGTKLVTVHDPIRPGKMAPDENLGVIGHIRAAEGTIELNAGREKTAVHVVNTADRPVQIGSHFHFFEVNKALEFDRAKTFGFRLDIPAGTAVRFEPGQSREVALVRFGGARKVGGLNSLTNGETTEDAKPLAIEKARAAGFKGA